MGGMQSAKAKAEVLGRKAKLAASYQELLDEFSNKDLKSVGNYTLGRLIGKGSFGKVYLATHKLTNGSKVVLKSANKDDSNLAREIHHHRQFVHPHIARLYEVIVTETLVWLVLEYCSGDELYNYLLTHGRLPVEKVQKTFAQLVGAVCYVHQQSCVHRDLKLENILLDKHENVKLCDFGFTREYEGKANYLQTFCGTICYSAPEMLKGEKYAGEKVDVWSLGVILYALLCGELPFDDDDDHVTRSRILTQEPSYPDHLPPDALSLLESLLSKRTLLRPSLSDILAHPFLAEHAAQQREILELQHPLPFSTVLEKSTLQRMRSAGVDIDTVIESVLAQRCDALAGWWTLLIEKEERKLLRRERKRREKEEHRISRRISQASSRVTTLATVEENNGETPIPRRRGRSERRSGHFRGLTIGDLPRDLANTANGKLSLDSEAPPPPIDKDSIRSASSSRHRRPIPPPKEGVLRSARSRGSTLHLVTTSNALALSGNISRGGSVSAGRRLSGAQSGDQKKVKKRPSQTILTHWKNWTHWLIGNTRRHRHHHKRGANDGDDGSRSVPDLSHKPASEEGDAKFKGGIISQPQTSKCSMMTGSRLDGDGPSKSSTGNTNGHARSSGNCKIPRQTRVLPGRTPQSPGSASRLTPLNPSLLVQHPRTQTSTPSNTYKRQSLSPSPLTPRSTVRRSSGPIGLRGRKSTSSSVSSVRSMIPAHHYSHSKASSTSSNGSVSTSMSKTPLASGRSPHHSLKVLPATPTSASFPSNIRLVRDRNGPPLSLFNEGMPSYQGRSLAQAPGSPLPFSSFNSPGGLLFVKRKRNIFKGPVLHFGSRDSSKGASGSASHSRSASASGLSRRSGELAIQEVDEDEGEGGAELILDNEIEEVDAFGPILGRPGEVIVEKIYEDGEGEDDGHEQEPEQAAASSTQLLPSSRL